MVSWVTMLSPVDVGLQPKIEDHMIPIYFQSSAIYNVAVFCPRSSVDRWQVGCLVG